MPGFLNPYLWLGFLVMLALSGFTGYRHGVKVTQGEYQSATVKAMTAMIERHNELSEADRKAIVAAERARHAWRAKQLEKAHELELEASRNHRPECSWSDIERGLLNEIIDGANGQASAAGGVPDGVRPDAQADGAERQGGQGLDRPRGLRFWRMPVEARGMRRVDGAMNEEGRR